VKTLKRLHQRQIGENMFKLKAFGLLLEIIPFFFDYIT
jgi:hypothetical protein